MIRTAAIAFAILLWPLASVAQDGLGLDLSAPEEKPPEEKPAEEAPEEDTSSSSSSSVGRIRAPEDNPEGKKPLVAKEQLLEGERDVTVEDRVKSVHPKLYLKKNRFELAPSAFFAVNDPYYLKYGLSVRGAYYLADNLAIAVRGSWINVLPTDDVRTAKRTFQSRIFFSVPQWSAMANVEWSPVYGKVAVGNNILHFDSYVLGGLGVLQTETSALPGRGLNPAADLGIGVRFIARDFLAVNAALINTNYVDAPTGSTKGATQNILTLNAGVSIFFPFKSTTQEAQ